MLKNWDERVLDAIRMGEFTEADKLRVMGWPTCAVGENCPAIAERLDYDLPRNQFEEDTQELGTRFADYVKNDLVLDAARVLAEIKHQGRKSRAKRAA